jgi:hypothetical protein
VIKKSRKKPEKKKLIKFRFKFSKNYKINSVPQSVSAIYAIGVISASQITIVDIHASQAYRVVPSKNGRKGGRETRVARASSGIDSGVFAGGVRAAGQVAVVDICLRG